MVRTGNRELLEDERGQENGENREEGECEKRGGRERTREWREQGTGRVGEERRKRENKRTGNKESVRREEEEREQESREQGECEKRGGRERTREWREQGTGSS